MQLWISDCSFAQHVLNIHQSGYSTVWLLWNCCHLSAGSVYTINHASVYTYSVTLFEAIYTLWHYNLYLLYYRPTFKMFPGILFIDSNWDLSEMWLCNISVNYFMSGLAEHTTCRLLQSPLLQLTHSLWASKTTKHSVVYARQKTRLITSDNVTTAWELFFTIIKMY